MDRANTRGESAQLGLLSCSGQARNAGSANGCYPYTYGRPVSCIRCKLVDPWHYRVSPAVPVRLGLPLSRNINRSLFEARPYFALEIILADDDHVYELRGLTSWSTLAEFVSQLKEQIPGLTPACHLDTYFSGKAIMLGERAIKVTGSHSRFFLMEDEVENAHSGDAFIMLVTRPLTGAVGITRRAMAYNERTLDPEPLCAECWDDLELTEADAYE